MSDHEPQPVTIDAVAMAMIRESEKREKEQATKQRIKELQARVAELEAKLKNCGNALKALKICLHFNADINEYILFGRETAMEVLKDAIAESEAPK